MTYRLYLDLGGDILLPSNGCLNSLLLHIDIHKNKLCLNKSN